MTSRNDRIYKIIDVFDSHALGMLAGLTQATLRKIAEHIDDCLDDCPACEAEASEEPALSGVLGQHGQRPVLAAASVEVDDEADAWYVRVLDEPVHHTTDSAPVNLDWTRDGSLIGIELLGPLRREQPDSAEVQWGVRTADGMCTEFERGGEMGARRFVNSCEGRATLIRRTVGPWIEVPS